MTASWSNGVLWLQRVGQHDLLTAAEEKELSAEVQSLIKLEAVRDELQETLQREPTLAEWATGVEMDYEVLELKLGSMQAARDRMISSNLRLVVSIAKHYINKCAVLQHVPNCCLQMRSALRTPASRTCGVCTGACRWRIWLQRALSA